MFPENFQPKSGKNKFRFLLNSVWKTNSSLPFPHHDYHIYSDGSGAFETTSEIDVKVGAKFNIDTCEFEIDCIESGPFRFDDTLKLTTVFFFAPNHND